MPHYRTWLQNIRGCDPPRVYNTNNTYQHNYTLVVNNVGKGYTKYCAYCHLVVYVILVPFLMTSFMNILVYVYFIHFGIMCCILTIRNELLPWMTEIKVK
jgi:hypothetical protein